MKLHLQLLYEERLLQLRSKVMYVHVKCAFFIESTDVIHTIHNVALHLGVPGPGVHLV